MIISLFALLGVVPPWSASLVQSDLFDDNIKVLSLCLAHYHQTHQASTNLEVKMSSLEPIKLHAHASGPNPWKVAIVLEELSLPYDMHLYSDMAELKKEPYTLLNPNGRVPTIEDPNTGITLWESGAIIQYLVDKYDADGKISYKTEPEKFHVNQWLYFQASGQGMGSSKVTGSSESSFD